MTATIYAAIDLKGNVHTRKSARAYSHVAMSGSVHSRKGDTSDGVLGFAGRLDLAQKNADSWRHVYPEAYVTEAFVVDVDRTGDDWKDTMPASAKWYAQILDGKKDPFVFGRTKAEAIKNLQEMVVKR